jgi:hypothetical protein
MKKTPKPIIHEVTLLPTTAKRETHPNRDAESKGKPARKKKTRIMGLTLKQIGILAGILLAWLCLVIVFFAFVSTQLNV